MSNKIAKSAREAIIWYTQGSYGGIMPIRQKTSSGEKNGVIIGARKATLWDSIKVALTYSKEEKAALAKARANTILALLWTDKRVKVGEREVRVAGEEDQTYTVNQYKGGTGKYLFLNGKVLTKALQNGLLPLNVDRAVVEQEPDATTDNKKQKKNLDPTQRWLFSYRDKFAPELRRPLNALAVRRTGAAEFTRLDGDKNPAGVAGWVPRRETRNFYDSGSPDQSVTLTDWGQFSTIVTSKGYEAPTEFPEQFVLQNDIYDDKGYLISAKQESWQLYERSEEHLRKGTAVYQGTDEHGNVVLRTFSLPETVSHPRNLILEHQGGPWDGHTTIWMVVPDYKRITTNHEPQLHWISVTFNKEGKRVEMPHGIREDGSYDATLLLRNPKKRGLELGRVSDSCQDPFTYVSPPAEKAQKPRAKVAFKDEAVALSYSEKANRPTIEIGNRRARERALAGKILKEEVIPTKEPNTLVGIAPKYESKHAKNFSLALRDAQEERLELLNKSKVTKLSFAEKVKLDAINERLKNFEKVNSGRLKAENAKHVVANYPKDIELELSPENKARAAELYEDAALGNLLQYEAGPKKRSHPFNPSVHQLRNWKESVAAQFLPRNMLIKWHRENPNAADAPSDRELHKFTLLDVAAEANHIKQKAQLAGDHLQAHYQMLGAISQEEGVDAKQTKAQLLRIDRELQTQIGDLRYNILHYKVLGDIFKKGVDHYTSISESRRSGIADLLRGSAAIDLINYKDTLRPLIDQLAHFEKLEKVLADDLHIKDFLVAPNSLVRASSQAISFNSVDGQVQADGDSDSLYDVPRHVPPEESLYEPSIHSQDDPIYDVPRERQDDPIYEDPNVVQLNRPQKVVVQAIIEPQPEEEAYTSMDALNHEYATVNKNGRAAPDEQEVTEEVIPAPTAPTAPILQAPPLPGRVIVAESITLVAQKAKIGFIADPSIPFIADDNESLLGEDEIELYKNKVINQ